MAMGTALRFARGVTTITRLMLAPLMVITDLAGSQAASLSARGPGITDTGDAAGTTAAAAITVAVGTTAE
jgi:hypothetical protein